STGLAAHGNFERWSLGGLVTAVISDGAGGWYIAGADGLYGQTLNKLFRVNSDGELDPTFSVTVSSAPESLLLAGGYLYIRGGFTLIGGAAHVGIARVDPTTGAVDTWDPGMNAGATVYAMIATGGTVYAGGNFSSVNSGGTTRNNAFAFDASTG